MTVKVCDAICGAGKTQACITMFNEQTDRNYIFVTPYLTEVDRIKEQCVNSNFYSPERDYEQNEGKLQSLHRLLEQKKNIATTHALFALYNEQTKELIHSGHYTLVLDEVIEAFQPASLNVQDLDILVNSNMIQEQEQGYVWANKEYEEGVFSGVAKKSQSSALLKYKNEMYFWSIPPDTFTSFDQVYILTYLFKYQIQKYFFDLHNIDYEYIGTKNFDGVYRFCSAEQMERARDLRSQIHILDLSKYNDIGEQRTALSSNWYTRAKGEPNRPKLLKLKNNLYSVFRNVYKCKQDQNMWTTFKDYKELIKGKGYTNNFVSFNQRAINGLTNKTHLAYLINVYMQTWTKNYLSENGVKNISEDMYAISVLIQWLFRSAIRTGGEVYLYLPSKRMRVLLTKWLDNLAKGRDLEPIKLAEEQSKEPVYSIKSSSSLQSKLKEARLRNTKKRS